MRLREVLTAVVVSGSLVFWAGGSWAQETVPPPESTDGMTTPTEEEETAPLPSQINQSSSMIRYAAIEGYGFKINISGISIDQVQDFTWDGSSIGGLLESMLEQGVVEMNPTDTGFEIGVQLDSSTLGTKATFGVVLWSGDTITKELDFTNDRDLGITIAIVGIGVTLLTTYYGNKEDKFVVTGKLKTKQKVCGRFWCSTVLYDYIPTGTDKYAAQVESAYAGDWKWVGSDGKTLSDTPYWANVNGDGSYGVAVSYCKRIRIFTATSRGQGYITTGSPWWCKPFDNDDGINIILP